MGNTSSTYKGRLINHSKLLAEEFVLADEKTEGSTMYSPLSVSLILRLVYLISSNNIKEILEAVLSKSDATGFLDRTNVGMDLNNFLSATEEDADMLRVLIGVFINEALRVDTPFDTMLVAKKIHCKIRYLNTKTDAAMENSLAQANNYVARKTQGQIQNILLTENLTKNTNTLLINTVYFRANWHEVKFIELRKQNFHGGAQKSAVMMISRPVALHTYKDAHYNCVKVPYQGGFSLHIFVQRISTLTDSSAITGASLLETEKVQFKLEEYMSKLSSGAKTLVELHLPKFELDTTLDISDWFVKQGCGQLFTDEVTLPKLDVNENLKITKIIHSSRISINEGRNFIETPSLSGTSAEKDSKDNKVTTVNCNRPFYYAITNYDGIIIFNGIYRN